jgi:hypothetical protein
MTEVLSREEAIAMAQAVVPGPCPGWCELPAGHKFGEKFTDIDWDEDGDRRAHLVFSRSHVTVVDGISVEQVESHYTRTGLAALVDAPEVYMYGPMANWEGAADSAELRKIAGQLITAADKLDEIAAAHR